MLPIEAFHEIATKIYQTTPTFGRGEFPMSYMFFSGEYDRVEFDSLNAFLLLEELETLIAMDHGFTEMQHDQMMLIYNNAKYQAYNTTTITLEEITV